MLTAPLPIDTGAQHGANPSQTGRLELDSKFPPGKVALLPTALREQAALVLQADRAAPQLGVLHVAVEEARAHLDRAADIAGPAHAQPAIAALQAWVEHEAVAVEAVVDGAGSQMPETRSALQVGHEL